MILASILNETLSRKVPHQETTKLTVETTSAKVESKTLVAIESYLESPRVSSRRVRKKVPIKPQSESIFKRVPQLCDENWNSGGETC